MVVVVVVVATATTAIDCLQQVHYNEYKDENEDEKLLHYCKTVLSPLACNRNLTVHTTTPRAGPASTTRKREREKARPVSSSPVPEERKRQTV